MAMLRSVALPAGVPGELVLSAMPGRYRPLDEDIAEAESSGISRIVCLAPRSEIQVKSPAYARALRSRSLPWPVEFFPIEDRGTADNREAFREFISHMAADLRAGEGILLHCGAGIGRTGMVAVCVLISLGSPKAYAEMVVRRAGSYPERPEQRELIQWFADNFRDAQVNGPQSAPQAGGEGNP